MSFSERRWRSSLSSLKSTSTLTSKLTRTKTTSFTRSIESTTLFKKCMRTSGCSSISGRNTYRLKNKLKVNLLKPKMILVCLPLRRISWTRPLAKSLMRISKKCVTLSESSRFRRHASKRASLTHLTTPTRCTNQCTVSIKALCVKEVRGRPVIPWCRIQGKAPSLSRLSNRCLQRSRLHLLLPLGEKLPFSWKTNSHCRSFLHAKLIWPSTSVSGMLTR